MLMYAPNTTMKGHQQEFMPTEQLDQWGDFLRRAQYRRLENQWGEFLRRDQYTLENMWLLKEEEWPKYKNGKSSQNKPNNCLLLTDRPISPFNAEKGHRAIGYSEEYFVGKRTGSKAFWCHKNWCRMNETTNFLDTEDSDQYNLQII